MSNLTPEDVRAALMCSPHWDAVTSELPLMAVAVAPPVPLDECTPGELMNIAAWADAGPATPLPPVLAKYIEGVKAHKLA